HAHWRPMRPQWIYFSSTLPMPQNPISGFDFNISGQRTILALDVAYTSKNTYRYRLLDHCQQLTFKGQPFTPTCVAEVIVVQEGYQEFNDLDQKFALKWTCQVVYRTSHGWNNVNGGNVLPGFTLEVEKIDDAISQKSSESSSSESDETINCPKCGATFSNDYTFMKHYEDNHARKW
ncbi:16621_t:CDS:2, partial [Entrophospora sp. SA101]